MDQILDVLRQYGFLFSILGGVAAAVGLVFGIYKASHNKQVRFLHARIHALERELAAAKEAGDPVILKEQNSQLLQENGNLQHQLGVTATNRKTLEGQCDQLNIEVTSLNSTLQAEREASRQKIEALNAALDEQKEQLVKQERVEQRRENLVKQALKLEGRIWQRKVLCRTPHFRPLDERHVAIVSVLNLKGGVGKTTITSQLGAALSSRGYRVLFVDLDLQGSLSGLFVHETILKERSEKALLLQHFLTNTANRRKANLLEHCVPVLDGKSAIIPATDTMGYAQMSLTMRWLLRLGKKDNSFLLRRGLHQKRVTSRYDIVLLDCPPILNACCLNALAASDYVLVPAVPSRSAVARVPLSLRRLQLLSPIINPNLQVVGAVLNRTRAAISRSGRRTFGIRPWPSVRTSGNCLFTAFRRRSGRRTRCGTTRTSSTRRPPGASCKSFSRRSWTNWKRGSPMTVGEFQCLLTELGRFLRTLKATAAAREVEEAGAKLAAFKDYKLKAFGDLLVKAEEYARLGPQAQAPKTTRKTKADPAAIDQACLRLLQVHNQAIDPSTTLEAIEAAVTAVQTLDPPKAKLDDLARKVGIGQRFTRKADVLKAIRQKILSVKGSWDRKDA